MSVLSAMENGFASFSCKTRFCPSCGNVRTDEWVRRISQELLDVPQLHLTLAIAHELHVYRDHDRYLLKVLLIGATDAVRKVIAKTYGDMKVGLIYTYHTFDRDLVFEPHVHLVMTKWGMKYGTWVVIDGVPSGRLAAT